jgi:hypothetical protein
VDWNLLILRQIFLVERPGNDLEAKGTQREIRMHLPGTEMVNFQPTLKKEEATRKRRNTNQPSVERTQASTGG